jgi:hypothetical protein
MADEVAGPVAGARMTEDYVRSVGRLAYLWGWPLVNVHNRLSIMEQVPTPGLLAGVVPAAPPTGRSRRSSTAPGPRRRSTGSADPPCVGRGP